jgi:hypothetical protein
LEIRSPQMKHYTLFWGQNAPFPPPPKKNYLSSEAHIGLFVQNLTLMLYDLINHPNLMGAHCSCGQYQTTGKNSSYFCVQFLKGLVSAAKGRGDTYHASKVTGVMQNELIRKRWGRINGLMRKPQGSLTVRVKVPTAERGHTEY